MRQHLSVPSSIGFALLNDSFWEHFALSSSHWTRLWPLQDDPIGRIQSYIGELVFMKTVVLRQY